MHRIRIWISALLVLNITTVSSNLLDVLNAASVKCSGG